MRLAEKLCVGRWINKPFSIKSGKSSDFYRKKYRSRFISIFFNWQILFINDSFFNFPLKIFISDLRRFKYEPWTIKKEKKINLFVEISSKRYFLQSIFSSSSQLSIRTAFPLWSGSISILGINLTSFVLKFPILGFYHQHTQKLFVKMKTNFQPGMKLVCNLKHAGH